MLNQYIGLNVKWLLVIQNAAALSCQCKNVSSDVHLTGIFLCWQSLVPEPKCLFCLPQLHPEDYLFVYLFHLTQLLFFVPIPFLNSIRKKNKKSKKTQSYAVRFKNLFIKFGILKPLLVQCCHGNH